MTPEGTLAEHHEKNHNLTGLFSRLHGTQGISDFDLMRFLAISAAKHVSRLGALFGYTMSVISDQCERTTSS